MAQGFTHDFIDPDIRVATNLIDVSNSNAGTTETDLFVDTIPKGTLIQDGNFLNVVVAGSGADSNGDTRVVRMYFAGTSIFSTSVLNTLSIGAPIGWYIKSTIIRDSGASIRIMTHCIYIGFDPVNTLTRKFMINNYATLSGLNFNNDNTFKITGQTLFSGAGAVSGSLTANFCKITYNK